MTSTQAVTHVRVRTAAAIASLITVAFMGSVVVTPLYSLYQDEYGFSEITLTLVYAVYVIGNVVALLLFGQISDQLGRKRVALPALGFAALSAVVFLLADGTPWLYAGRLLIGLAVGVLSGTGTAWLAEYLGGSRRALATVTAATANLIGIAIGPLLGGVLAQYAPDPLVLPFVVYLVLIAVVAVAVARAPDPRERRRVRDVRVQPRLGVPADRLRAFAPLGVTGFVAFGMGGLYFALIPGIVVRELRIDNVAVGGLVVFELGAVAAACIVLGRGIEARTAMTIGLVSLVPATGLVVLAQDERSLPLLVVATALAGVTLALGYRGSLEIVNRIAPDDRRAEVVSSYYVCCFVGNALPVIGVGVLTTLTGSVVASAAFAATVAALALAALAAHLRGSADERLHPR